MLRILFVWTTHPNNELGLTEISRLTEINKSTVYKILQSLQHHDLVAFNPETKKYSLEHGVLKLGNVFLNNLDIKNAAHPIIKELAEKSGKTVTLALRKDTHLVFIDRVDGNESVRFYCDIGKVTYYNSGAAAKAVFAHLTAQEQEGIIKHEPPAHFTEKTKTWEELLEEVPSIRQKGYSISDEEVDAGVFAVGAPIFDNKGRVIAGMAIAGLKFSLSEAEIGRMILLIREHSKMISSKLGYAEA